MKALNPKSKWVSQIKRTPSSNFTNLANVEIDFLVLSS